VSTTGELPPASTKLHDHLSALGARSTLRVLEDPLAVPFGESYLRDVSAVRRDTRLELDLRLADACADWLRGTTDAAGRNG
jgi:hypothetical protein